MKTNKKKMNFKIAVALIITVLFAACSDGEYRFTNPSVGEPEAPIIQEFKATPAEVEMGESTTFSWVVVGADEIEITSVATEDSVDGLFQQYHFTTTEMDSSVTLDGIMYSTDFILTAKKTVQIEKQEEETPVPLEEIEVKTMAKMGQLPVETSPEPFPELDLVEKVLTDSVVRTVTVVASPDLSFGITADDSQIEQGDFTIIRWEALMNGEALDIEKNPVIVSASTGEPVVAGADCGLDSVSGTVEGYPAIGCAAVMPEESTNYILTIQMEDGNTASAYATVDVSVQELEVNIFANNQDTIATVNNFNDLVTITFDVTPIDKPVTVTADQPVQCEGPLPTDMDLSATDGQGSIRCGIQNETRFTITTTDGEATDSVLVILRGGGAAADVKFSAPAWAFIGERITVEIDPDAVPGSNRSLIQEVKVGTKTVTLEPQGKTLVQIAVPSLGLDASVVSTTGNEVKHPKLVQAVVPTTFPLGQDINNFSKIYFDQNDPALAYIGVNYGSYNGGLLTAFKVNMDEVGTYARMDIDITNPDNNDDTDDSVLDEILLSGGSYNANASVFLTMVGEYPVSALVKDEEGRLFMGTTGVLMYKADENSGWKLITLLQRFYTGEHQTCQRDTQFGNEQDAVGSLGRVCDLIAKDDHLVIATDMGIYTLTNVAEALATPENSNYAGLPEQTGQVDRNMYPTFGHVAHDLEIASDGTIYAGSELGLFKSSDNGVTWTQMQGIEGPIFAVAVNKDNNKLHAGTLNSVETQAFNTDDDMPHPWQSAPLGGDTHVYSIETDPTNSSVVMASTGVDVFASRNAGESFAKINKVAGMEENTVRSIGMSATEIGSNAFNYNIVFAGEQGAAKVKFVSSVGEAQEEATNGDEEVNEEEDQGEEEPGEEPEILEPGTIQPGDLAPLPSINTISARR